MLSYYKGWCCCVSGPHCEPIVSETRKACVTKSLHTVNTVVSNFTDVLFKQITLQALLMYKHQLPTTPTTQQQHEGTKQVTQRGSKYANCHQ